MCSRDCRCETQHTAQSSFPVGVEDTARLPHLFSLQPSQLVEHEELLELRREDTHEPIRLAASKLLDAVYVHTGRSSPTPHASCDSAGISWDGAYSSARKGSLPLGSSSPTARGAPWRSGARSPQPIPAPAHNPRPWVHTLRESTLQPLTRAHGATFDHLSLATARRRPASATMAGGAIQVYGNMMPAQPAPAPLLASLPSL